MAGAALAVRLFLSSDQMKKLAVAQGQELLGRKIQLQDLSIGLSFQYMQGQYARRITSRSEGVRSEYPSPYSVLLLRPTHNLIQSGVIVQHVRMRNGHNNMNIHENAIQ